MRETAKNLSITIATLALALSVPPASAQGGEGWLARETARETAREYRERARYPEHSRALAPGQNDPVKEKRQPTRQSMPGPDGAEPALAVWASAVSYEVGRPVELFAELEGRGKPPAASAVTGEVRDDAGGVVATFAYRDDGLAPDAKAGDGVWSARVALPGGVEPELAASFLVQARATLGNGDLRDATGGFLVSRPGARLTGRYHDELRDGDVVVSAEIEVVEAGRFHLSGTLYEPQGEPIGVAQAAAELEPGRHWIDLAFYGLMFHERGASGPYRLGAVALARTGGMPNALADLVEDVHLTKPYKLGQTKARPFGEPALLEAAERLEREAERTRPRQ